MTNYLRILAAGVALVATSVAVLGCSDKSPDAPPEALNSRGASKSAAFEQMKANSGVVNPGAPGTGSK